MTEEKLMKVIKRDGRVVDFKKDKIKNAIMKAFIEVDGKDNINEERIDYLVENIVTILKNRFVGSINIEDIQDIVENALMEVRKDVAKAYILYRDKRTRERNKKTRLTKTIGEKLSASNIVNQNANIDEMSFGGRMGEASSEMAKDYALNYCMTEMSRNNHLNNEIYIHDLNSYAVGMHNCLTIPFDDLLAKGFNTRQTDVRPANSINTALQLVAVIFQLQSLQQFGGVSTNHLDTTLAPYVKKSFYKHYINGLKYISEFLLGGNYKEYIMERIAPSQSIEAEIYKECPETYEYAMDMTLKETQQAVEGMFHNLNTLQSRSGNQLPFTSLNFGTDTTPEGRMVSKAILEGCIKGVGKNHRTSIFPCVIFQYMKGVNDKPNTPNYDLYRLALQSTAKRLYPNYANVDWSGNEGYDKNDIRTYFSTMGLVIILAHLKPFEPCLGV